MSDENDSKTDIYSHGYVSMQKEISDLRTRLEEAERERDEWRDKYTYQAIDMDTDWLNFKAENAALKQKLGAVRGWLKGHSVEKSDYVMGMTSQLRKILDGGEK